MAAPKHGAYQDEEGHNDEESSDNSCLYNNDGDDYGIFNLNPDKKTTPGMPMSYNAKNSDNDIIAKINEIPAFSDGYNNEPGSIQSAETTNTNKTIGEEADLPPEYTSNEYTSNEAKETETAQYPTDSTLNRMDLAISSLQKEINKSEQERKENQVLVEKQFNDIIQEIKNKKYELIERMNKFYDDQKQQSLDRILELRKELISRKKEIERQQKEKQKEREKEKEKEEQLKKQKEEEKAAEIVEKEEIKNKDDIQQNALSNIISYQRLSIFGNKIKENASKLTENASKLAENATKLAVNTTSYIDSWINQDKMENVAEEALYRKHDKIRLFIPTDLSKLIKNDIKLSTEWWNPLTLNHIVYNISDFNVYRTRGINGWYNAFGTMKIRRGQTKRWNIKILEREKQHHQTGRKQPADVVLGVIQSIKARPQDKENGFWQKGCDGFGLYGWNGKLFHKKTRGKVYCDPFYIGNTIGIELNMKPTPGMDSNNSNKSKPKTHLRNSTKLVLSGGVVKFYIDDEDLGIAFYDLDLDKEYSLAVALNNTAYTLQLCD